MNPDVTAVAPPPIADVQRWIKDRAFPAERPLLDVAQAVPSHPPAEELIAHVGVVAARPETARYSDIFGLPALREALASHFAEAYGAPVPAACVGITAGCNQAFCVAAMALLARGDEVVLPLPYYFNHHMWLQMIGVRPVYAPFAAEAGGVPDVEAIAGCLTERTRAIVLISPNNPTGAVYPAPTIEAIAALARERGLLLLLDETYKDFRAGGGAPHRLFEDPDWGDYLVHLYSFSKAYSLTGYRVGSLTAGARVLAEVQKILDCVAICPPRIGQEAALYALGHLAAWRDARARIMSKRLEALRGAFRRNELAYSLESSGAYFAYVRHPFTGVPAADVARRLADEQNVLCVPGSVFGPDQEDYLRFAFANLEETHIPALVDRLIASQ